MRQFLQIGVGPQALLPQQRTNQARLLRLLRPCAWPRNEQSQGLDFSFTSQHDPSSRGAQIEFIADAPESQRPELTPPPESTKVS